MTLLVAPAKQQISLLDVLTDEGLRLFFPLGALYAALWPFLWVVVLGFDLPLARQVPATQWHPHEMLIGAYGAALIGFVTSAVPEWTDTKGPGQWMLLSLAALWGIGRCVGVLGFDLVGVLGALADSLWLAGLLIYVAHVSWRRRTTSLSGFGFWLAVLAAALLFTGRYRWIERVLIALVVLMSLVFIATAVMVKPSMTELLRHSVTPTVIEGSLISELRSEPARARFTRSESAGISSSSGRRSTSCSAGAIRPPWRSEMATPTCAAAAGSKPPSR